MDVSHLVFFAFSAVALLSAAVVVASRHPMRSVWSLVLTFVAASGAWMICQAEFLSLVLIFVYVGAVMTLFLFVVMMFNRDTLAPNHRNRLFWPSLALGLITFSALLGQRILQGQVATSSATLPLRNTQALGRILYTDHLLAFETAAIILLIAMVSAIVLVFQGSRNRKAQDIGKQVLANKRDRLRVVQLESEA